MKKKVLLMGRSGSGKTSMRSIIFANYIARDTMRLGATIDVEHSHVRFLGNLVLNLWDCGGQEAFMENYFESQRDHIFSAVEVLIYVFDVESRELQRDIHYFESCLEALAQNSKDAKIFCLVHKMDLVPQDDRESVFAERQAELLRLAAPMSATCFQTSIWDESLFKAWSSIVYSLVPNVGQLERQLNAFCDILEADETIIFERATFLVISHVTRREYKDVHRHEKLSNVAKQFKLAAARSHSHFSSMRIANSNFNAHLIEFTSNTYIMIVTSGDIEPAAVDLNLQAARPHFEKVMGAANTGM